MIRILIADDQSLVCEVLKHRLSKEADFEVIGVAHDGSEALLKAEQLQPDIILMDVNMPKMNGLEATQAIARHYPKIDIISLSGNVTDGIQALVSGAKTHLTKDNATTELIDRINQVRQQPNRNSLAFKYRLNDRTATKQTEPLDEIALSAFNRENLEIINAEYEIIGGESTTATVEPKTRSAEQNPKSCMKRGEQDLEDRESNSYYKSNLEETIALLELHIGEFKAKYVALIAKYREIAYNIQSSERKKDNLLHQINATLQQNQQNDPNLSLRLEEQLVRLDSSLIYTQKQINLVVKLCTFVIILVLLALIFLTAFAIIWS